MFAGPQSMKFINLFSRILCKLLWTWKGSTFPWITFRIDINLLSENSFSRIFDDTMIFLVCKSFLMTSNTVVFRVVFDSCAYEFNGVYPVIKKWHRGVGTNDATKLTRSLFMYPGYLNVVVLAAITVETKAFVCENDGLSMLKFSSAIRFSAVLSRTTTLSLFRINLFNVRRELYGCTTTSIKVQCK